MFQEWGFLLGEIWFLLAVAGLFGLLAGWIIWGRRDEVTVDTGEAERLRADLAACRTKSEGLAARVTELEARPAPVAAPVMDAAKTLPPVTAGPMVMPQMQNQPQALMGGAAAGVRAVVPEAAVRPAALDKPRGGKADDPKLIKGVGPKLEKLCNKLGFWHFDQIANWTAAEVAWVDDNLEGFKGRVSRDEWIVQARDLAAGKAPRPGGEN